MHILFIHEAVIGLKTGSFCKCMTFWATGPDYILNEGGRKGPARIVF